MRHVIIAVGAVICWVGQAQAAADPAKCIVKAAARLPAAPGLTITDSKHRELTAKEAVNWKNHPYGLPIIVEISAHAAGQETSYTFLCTGIAVRPLPDGKVP